MKTLLSCVFAVGIVFVLACTPSAETPPQPVVVPVIETYSFESQPTWQDEFDKNGLPDATKWDYDVGGGGWGNNELQYYTRANAKNARIEDGNLIIETHKEDFENRKYTSARLVTKKKGDWLYGKVVVRAKLPRGVGTWPAVWMLATNQTYGNAYWPDNGEIDIMEHVGFDPNKVHGNIHTKAFNHSIGTNKGGSIMVSTALNAFHDYAVEWLPSEIRFLVDGKLYFTFQKESSEWQKWPFDKPFHLIMNIAIGGSWGGQKGIDDSIFPQRMEIDYVRVYALKKN
jgi:beta-glucanase (GH16 family)